MPSEKILLVLNDQKLGDKLINTILDPAGFVVKWVTHQRAAESALREFIPEVVMVAENLDDGSGLELSRRLLQAAPTLPLVFIAASESTDMVLAALRMGASDCLCQPVQPEEVLQAISRSLESYVRVQKWLYSRARERTDSLRRKLDILESLGQVGRKVTAMLDLDQILKAVVDSAVTMTGAEEGSLLLLDKESGELYMRAARNFQDDFVRTFRLPINDTLAGEVVRTGQAVLLDEGTPKKIKTAYLVRTLLYVPLKIGGRVIGVLGVDNRHDDSPFLEEHLTLVAALADYAAIAVENARLYESTEVERKKLETILAGIGDGVIVVDPDKRIVVSNEMACKAFGVEDTVVTDRPVSEIFTHEPLLEFLENGLEGSQRTELSLDDGRTLHSQLVNIPQVGMAVTMQDITHLKELDRIKTDFVHTVSHDLRSPLTAILGYVELIKRVGEVNEQQDQFIKRVQISVRNITGLINDLLDLGRIESGFDAGKEFVLLPMILEYALDGLKANIDEKEHTIEIEAPEELPKVFGDPSRMRQMIDSILGNAIRYTPKGGKIKIDLQSETGQIIMQISDNGPGIPPADQPYIFDKFYRASNIDPDIPGSGLGLAIAKSIVENHQGRLWVESTLGKGTNFIVVLPTADDEL